MRKLRGKNGASFRRLIMKKNDAVINKTSTMRFISPGGVALGAPLSRFVGDRFIRAAIHRGPRRKRSSGVSFIDNAHDLSPRMAVA